MLRNNKIIYHRGIRTLASVGEENLAQPDIRSERNHGASGAVSSSARTSHIISLSAYTSL